MVRPYEGGEAGFGQSNRDAAIAYVVRRTHRSATCERYQALLQALFGSEINRGRLAGNNAGNRLCVLGRREFVLEIL